MTLTNDVHKQFADFFNREALKPYFYLLSKKLSEGHICIDLSTINQTLRLEEEGYANLLSEAQLKKEPLVSDGETLQPLVLKNHKLYLQRYFQYETRILEKLLAFVAAEKDNTLHFKDALFAQKEFVQQLFALHHADNTDWQFIAAVTAITHQFSIITGGPGTGKTTTVAKILFVLFQLNPQLRVALAAPTGKAATRMAESLKNAANNAAFMQDHPEIKEKFEQLIPSTIHRLLKPKRDSIYFEYDGAQPLACDLIIVDESSMIDIALLSKLLDAVPTHTKLILLGDKDQLASVEAGSLFGDLCVAAAPLNAFHKETAAYIHQFVPNAAARINDEHIRESAHPLSEHVVELKFSHRFSDTEGIGLFSKAIIGNDRAALKQFIRNEDERVFLDMQYKRSSLYTFASGFKEYIEEKDISAALKKLNKLRILCAVRDGAEGVYAMNRLVEHYLQEQKRIRINGEFYEHRPVMVNWNNYDLELFNGDVGIVRKDADGQLKVWFEDAGGHLKAILPASIETVETVFAMTIHKSQGSEFDQVMVVLPQNTEIELLTRELLYTAVTRAKEKVILQTTEEGLFNCASKRVERASGIADRF